MIANKTIITIILCASALSSGCSRSVSSGFVPEEGLTVSEIYHQSVQDSAKSWDRPSNLKHRAVNYKGYVREASNETQSRFKALENPRVPIFVYPHLAQIGDEQLVKPGYSTEFFLYKQNQFALASERY